MSAESNVPRGSSLNENQRRHLLVSCAHIDSLLRNIEEVMASANSQPVFPKYVNDLSPVRKKTIEDYLTRIRTQLIQVLQGQQIALEKPRITVTHSIHTALTFAEIAIEELSPKDMRGYGAVSETAAADLNGVMQELQSIVQQVHRYVLQGSAPDLSSRIQDLNGEKKDEIVLLRKIEEIVSRRGLVEFRSTLQMVLERLEDKSFEIAIFGRVSSGKSSLLNHVIGMEILPVGVTPVTAIPTRVAYGTKPEVQVRIEGQGIQQVELQQLPEFVDERLNPSNQKRVANILVRYPSARLSEGVILVDTPGLGSLATSGAAETLAYLPRCDIGVVLIDAGSTLSPEDVKTIQALNEATIPVTIVLSKADLVSESDRCHLRDYVQSHIRSELGLELPVRLVSILPQYASLLDSWFNEDIAIKYSEHQKLLRESIWRKVRALRDSVHSALQMQIMSQEHFGGERDNLAALTALRRGSGVLQAIVPQLRDVIEQVPRLKVQILGESAETVAKQWTDQSEVDVGEVLWSQASRRVMEVAALVREKIEHASTSLHRVLSEVSDALNVQELSRAEEMFVIREMPVFHMNREQVVVGKPKVVGLLGKGMLIHSASGRLKASEDALDAALRSYASLLRAWSDRALQNIEEQFAVYADRYRAQLDRFMNEKQLSSDEVGGIRADMERLSEATESTRAARETKVS